MASRVTCVLANTLCMDAGRQPHRADFLMEIVPPTW
jgi:hypothetical protein